MKYLRYGKTFLKYGAVLCVFVCAIFLLLIAYTHATSEARNDRDWSLDQSILPSAEFSGESVTVRNIRNFSYTSTSTYTPSYYDRTFNLNELESVDFIVEPLKPIAIAHTLVSFGFSNGDRVAISVEIRKEKGESFSPIKGLLNQFELMYVIADERDVLQLRALHRKDVLYVYPTVVSKEKMRELFVSMLTRANTLREQPEFYNTLTSTCTTNIVDHINEISPHRVPFDLRLIFPLHADEYAYELGLIDTSVPFSTLQQNQRVNEAIARYKDDPAFSRKIRE